jgi:hypothetical protein
MFVSSFLFFLNLKNIYNTVVVVVNFAQNQVRILGLLGKKDFFLISNNCKYIAYKKNSIYIKIYHRFCL